MILEELYRYIGQTVTIFTTSGGASGYGFTGVLLRVNPSYVTLVNRLGTPPSNPVSEMMERESDRRNGGDGRCNDPILCTIGSMCDIPLDKIAAFNHNAN